MPLVFLSLRTPVYTYAHNHPRKSLTDLLHKLTYEKNTLPTLHDELQRLRRPKLLEDGHGRHRVSGGENRAEKECRLVGLFGGGV